MLASAAPSPTVKVSPAIPARLTSPFETLSVTWTGAPPA